MALGLDLDLGEQDSASPSNPANILAFVRDNIGNVNLGGLARIEDRLHNRLRILREREQDPEPIRQALVLCADRRREIDAASVVAQPGASRQTTI